MGHPENVAARLERLLSTDAKDRARISRAGVSVVWSTLGLPRMPHGSDVAGILTAVSSGRSVLARPGG
jgi:hypothetical protein